jgi:hypothetical protein
MLPFRHENGATLGQKRLDCAGDFHSGTLLCARTKMGMPLHISLDSGARSDFGKEIKERVNALPQLRLNLLTRAFKNVHGDARAVAIFQLDGGIAYFRNFIGRQEPQAVNQCEICHTGMLAGRPHLSAV